MTATPGGASGDGPWGPADPGSVHAAGGIVTRRRDGALEVLVVHRPRYDDWSFPKGKCDPGETFAETALREVEEETGFVCALGEPLDELHYVDHKGRPKVVRYWAMTVVGDDADGFVANDEVDVALWLAPADAEVRLSYVHDAAILRRLPAT